MNEGWMKRDGVLTILHRCGQVKGLFIIVWTLFGVKKGVFARLELEFQNSEISSIRAI